MVEKPNLGVRGGHVALVMSNVVSRTAWIVCA